MKFLNLNFCRLYRSVSLKTEARELAKYKLALLEVWENRQEKGSTKPSTPTLKKKCKAIPVTYGYETSRLPRFLVN
jgi:hypothetical protein